MIKPPEFEPSIARGDIVVIGGSAGGLAALQALLEQLDPALQSALFAVLHQSASSPGNLPTILARRSRLPIVTPTDGALIRPGQVYVAPPNVHLFLQSDRVRLLRGPPENAQRPSIDTLFRSAAVSYGPRVVGVVLSGTLDDGTAGLEAIKTCGGTAVVQAPDEATHPEMPASALARASVDHCLRVAGIARLLGQLALRELPVGDSAGVDVEIPEHLRIETEFALSARDIDDMDQLGELSGYVCPSCDGCLWKIEGAGLLRFRCHVGHAFSAETLLNEQGQAVERALYTALRLLEERARAARHLARGRFALDATGLEAKALELDETSAVLKKLILLGARQLEKGSMARPEAR